MVTASRLLDQHPSRDPGCLGGVWGASGLPRRRVSPPGGEGMRNVGQEDPEFPSVWPLPPGLFPE